MAKSLIRASGIAALSSCVTIRASWHDEAAGKKRGHARRRAKLYEKFRIFV
jgi:hypothetical protein